MARLKNDSTIEDALIIPEHVANELTAQHLQVSEECRLAVEQYGDGIPFDEIIYQQKVAFHLKRSAEEMLDGCRALLVTRIHLDNGRWGEFLRRIGLEDRLARRMVATARKFSGAEMKPLIQAAASKSKLFELLILDDEELVKVAQGADDAVVTLDEIDRMPTSELRKALREARADGEATKKVLADKNTKIDKLETQIEKAKTAEKPERPIVNYNVVALRQELTEKQYEYNIVLKHIGTVLENLRESDEDYIDIARETLETMQQSYMNMAALLGVNLLDEVDDTSWLPSPSEIDNADFAEAEDGDTY